MAWSRDRHLARWAALYSNQTPAEVAIEPAIASLGIPYRTQHPIWSISAFADFALPTLRVILEVDDKSHNQPAKRRADAERTAKLNRRGWRVARCTNEEAILDPYKALSSMLTSLGIKHSATQGATCLL